MAESERQNVGSPRPRVTVGPLGIGEVKRRLPIYAKAPEVWCRQVVGFEPDPQQEPIIANYLENKFTSVKSGHGSGKSASASIVGLHFLSTRPFTLVPCTAPTRRQLKSILWKEFSKWTRRSPYLSAILEVMGEKIVVKGHEKEWYAEAITSRVKSKDDSNVGLQGFHGDPKEGGGILYVVDEASGVPEASMSAVEGALTEEYAFALMIGNPTHLSGTFYNSFHKDEDLWVTHTLSCESSEIVDPAYIERMAKKYGRDSDIFRIKVLGEFPSRETEGLVPLVFVIDAHQTDPEDVPGGDRVYGGLDVALSGSNRTVLYLRKGCNVFLRDICPHDKEEDIAEWAAHYIDRHDIYSLAIDCVGPGSGVFSHLRRMGYRSRIEQFKSGWTPIRLTVMKLSPNEELEFYNLRAQGYWYLKQLFYSRGISLSYAPEDENLREQLTSIRTKPSRDASKIQVESKQDMAARAMPSPDEADALMLCFISRLASNPTLPEAVRTFNPQKQSSFSAGRSVSAPPVAGHPLGTRRASPWSTLTGGGRGSTRGGSRFTRGRID